MSVVAARHALRRTDQALRADSARLARAGQPEHPVLIMNPKSGGGKAERFQLATECRKRGIEPVLLRPGDDLRELAEDAVRRGADVLGMAGGDGSQALVASVAARAGLGYVCVPAGTRNHFALDLGLDRADVVGALDAYADGLERYIDLAEVNGRTFVNNASLGLYAQVVQAPEYRDAKLRTAAAMLPDLLGPEAQPVDLCFTGPDGTERRTAHLVLISNNPYQLVPAGGGLGTRERIDRGVLGLVTVTVTDAAQASRFLALEAAGQPRRFSGWAEWTVPRFEIRSGTPVPVGVDGEALILDPPLVFTSGPRRCGSGCPAGRCGARPRPAPFTCSPRDRGRAGPGGGRRRTLRRSPAARTVHVLSASTVAGLARVATGTAWVRPG